MTTPDPADDPTVEIDGAVPAPDQTERVILQAAEEVGEIGCPCDLLVVADSTGALTAAALDLVADHPDAVVRSWNTSREQAAILAELFAAQILSGRLLLSTGEEPQRLEEFAAGAQAHLALARLPKSLAALEDLARRLALLAARSGREDLTLIAGGRVKHMTRTQNEVLAGAFGEVRASRGLGKSRALIASAPRADAPTPEPVTGTATVRIRAQEREIPLRALGGVFGGARADAGSLLLLDSLDRALVAGEVAAGAAVDLGSGNGLLTAYLAAALPEAQVLASDDDADAVASTRATLAAAGAGVAPGAEEPEGARDAAGAGEAADPGDAASGDREPVRVTWDAALSREQDGSADLVLLNPPFHDGTAVDATLVQDLLDAAARVLRPGGQLWFVHNSHLRYRPELEARVGTVRQRARDRRFTVLSAVVD